MRKLNDTNRTRKRSVRHSWIKAGPGIQRCAICGITKRSNKSNINAIEADKNEGDERNILLHIGILSPFNDDPVIIIKQKGV